MTPWTNNKAFNVSQFTQRIKGVQYLSKFYFKLLDNENYRDLFEASPDLKDKVENLFFYSDNITIPSRGITTETYSYANGFRFEVPKSTNYGDGNINVNMLVDANYDLYDFFINWMNKIHSKETGFFGFHNTYTTDIEIKQLESTSDYPGNLPMYGPTVGEFVVKTEKTHRFKVELGNCYPKAVSAIEFRHDAKDMVKFNVNFSYEKIDYNKTYKDDVNRKRTNSSANVTASTSGQ